MASMWGRARVKNPKGYNAAHIARARKALEQASAYFPNHRVMSEALGSSYEYLAELWSWRVPGPEVIDKLERMTDLCRQLKSLQHDRVQIGWWLASVHFSLEDPPTGKRTCPGRLAMAHPQLVPAVLEAAFDDFRCHSYSHQAAVLASGVNIPQKPDKDPRQAVRKIPWFLGQRPSRKSLAEQLTKPGSPGYAETRRKATALPAELELIEPAAESSLEALVGAALSL
jgi:hypothetical protein